MPHRSPPPPIPPGPLSRTSSDALNGALRDLYRFLGGFSNTPPIIVREDAAGVNIGLGRAIDSWTTQALYLGEQSVALASATVNDLAVNAPGQCVLRLSTTHGATTLSGIIPTAFSIAGNCDQLLVVENTGSGSTNTITLTNEDTNSTAANRFHLPGAANVTLPVDYSAVLLYDPDITRWRLVAMSLTGGYTGTTTVCNSISWNATTCVLTVTTQTYTWVNGQLISVV